MTAQDVMRTIRTDIPARLDRLPWTRWHWMIIVGLGTVWILDGLEVTIVGNVATRLGEPGSGIDITTSQVTGLGAALYVLGACVGALFFGWLTDRFGRKKLFMLTLGVYLLSTALTAVSWTAWWFFLFRFFTGFGIGGEYAAINSAIDELIPRNHRGRVDIMINGSYWLGAIGGALLSIPALNTAIFPKDIGWRLTFVLGVIFGLAILLVRRNVPESPRWLFIHGRERQAEKIVEDIEQEVHEESGKRLADVDEDDKITIEQRSSTSFVSIAKTMFQTYPRRSILGFALFIGQAFLYNAITFSFGSILTTYFKVSSDATGYYYAIVAAGNFIGPVLLARLFDTWGRRPMITGTYLLSGSLLIVTAIVFGANLLTATTITACWFVVLFFASAGASSAYLTVSEVFPLETRALAIAFFYAIGTAAGGIAGPLLFAKLLNGQLVSGAIAFGIGGALMVAGGIVAAFLAVDAEQRSLEDIARPLSAQSEPAPA